MSVDVSDQAALAPRGVVSLIGGDQLTRLAVVDAAGPLRLEVRGFVSVDAFLRSRPAEHGCIVVDSPVRPVGQSPAEPLRAFGVRTPVVLVTPPTTVRAAVRAMESGAASVLEKPVSTAELSERISRGVAADEFRVRSEKAADEAAEKLARLTTKEQRTLGLILEGLTNKQIAEELGLSVRAVEDRRARTIKRAGVRNVLDLARLVEASGWHPPQS